MSTVSVTISESTVSGNLLERFGTITGGTSDYSNGTGYVFTPGQLGLYSISHVRLTPNAAGGYTCQTSVNSSGSLVVKVFNPTAGAGTGTPNTISAGTLSADSSGATIATTIGTLAATSTPASGMTAVTSTSAQPAIPAVFTGTEASTASGTLTISGAGVINSGPGKEVASSTDLHTVVFNFTAFGH